MEKLHHQVGCAEFGRAHVADTRHVGRLQLNRGASFPKESLDEFRVCHPIREHELDGNLLT